MIRLTVGTKVRVKNLLDELLPFKGRDGKIIRDDGGDDEPGKGSELRGWPYTVEFDDHRNGFYCSAELEVLP